jgi:hypothetical protein
MEVMTAERNESRQSRLVIVGFVALAVLDGPVRGYTFSALNAAVNFQTIAAGAVIGVVVGLPLLAAARRQSGLGGIRWLAVLFLLVPQWLESLLASPHLRAIPGLHATGWGVGFMLSLAAPLWLALLAALEWVKFEVPRAVVGAGIAGVGAAYLVIPVAATSVAANQIFGFALQMVLNIAVVFAWAYAVPRLAGVGTLAVAGAFLLLSGLGDAGFSLLFERSAWQPVDWRSALLPLLVEAMVVVASCWLWFWLLQRMALAAFSMHPLAVWAAAMLQGFAYAGFMQWRIDTALAMAVGAIVVALRAKVAEEQPVALGLSGG